MVAGMPLAITLGNDKQPPLPIVSALVLSRNGNAITLNKEFQKAGVQTLADLKTYLGETPDRVHTFGMVHPASMHNFMLRYWLASGGIDPDRDVSLLRIPPAQMVASLKGGNIDGYCVGDPWNAYAVREELGYIIATDLDIWPGHPEKILGVREEWAQQYPKTHLALIRALLQACEYCDDYRNRENVVELIAQPQYLGVDARYIRPGLIGPYDRGLEGEPEHLLRFNQFFVDRSTCPGRSEALWMLTQLARWGYISFPKNWVEILERVRRPELYSEACRQLDLPGLETDRKTFSLFDGMVFNPDDPVGYIERFTIRRDLKVVECVLP
jgi:nitrate/nitrite transport system ATP-binding protein